MLAPLLSAWLFDSEAIGRYPWKLRDFGKPTAIGFPFVLHADIHKDLGGEDFQD
jgi:hypothetical protein